MNTTPDFSSLPKADTAWFQEARFGLFIHWGLYAAAARHEWVMNNEEIPVEEYERKYFRNFDPDLYDPAVWAEAAAGAGMRYFVVTTKHHEGFCLWDSKFTDYKAPNTKAGRDLLRPLVDAMRAKGLRTGFYYSLIDWHHPLNFIDNKVGPYRNRPAEEIARMNEGRDQAAYAKYIRNQVTELLTDYGPVDIIWFDFSYPNPDARLDFSKGKGREAWESETLYRLVRSLAPNIIVDDRLDLPGAGDVVTPEQFQPAQPLTRDGKPIVWEACQTFSGSWGYYRDEQTWRSSGEIIRTLIDCVSKGGNLLLNVGPTGRGEFDYRALGRLREIGQWMRLHSAAIHGCGPAPAEFKAPQDCKLTYNAKTNRLYIHILSWQLGNIFMEGMAGRVEYAQFLHDHSEVTTNELPAWQAEKAAVKPGTCAFNLPKPPPHGVEVPVIEVILK